MIITTNVHLYQEPFIASYSTISEDTIALRIKPVDSKGEYISIFFSKKYEADVDTLVGILNHIGASPQAEA